MKNITIVNKIEKNFFTSDHFFNFISIGERFMYKNKGLNDYIFWYLRTCLTSITSERIP
jgi:hypothetical protein